MIITRNKNNKNNKINITNIYVKALIESEILNICFLIFVMIN